MSDALRARAEIASHLKEALGVQGNSMPKQRMPLGIAAIDSLIGGLPRGGITELLGTHSSGRTTLMLAALVAATVRGDLCALVDTSDALDVASAHGSGVKLKNLLWVRCGSDLDNALRATELLLRSGVFAFTVLDLGNVSINDARRIQLSCWMRFRHALKDTGNVCLVMSQESLVKSLAELALEIRNEGSDFSGACGLGFQKTQPAHTKLLLGLKLKVEQRRPFSLNAKTDLYAAIAFP